MSTCLAPFQPTLRRCSRSGDPPPSGLSADERRTFDELKAIYATGIGYAQFMATRPQSLYGVADSPVDLAALILTHDAQSYDQIVQLFDGRPFGDITRDDILDNITLYWLTNTGVSSARLYWENKYPFFDSSTSRFRPPSAFFRTSSMKLHGAGPIGRIANSSTSTSSQRADTLQPGSSRSSFQKKFARASAHCANRRRCLSARRLLPKRRTGITLQFMRRHSRVQSNFFSRFLSFGSGWRLRA